MRPQRVVHPVQQRQRRFGGWLDEREHPLFRKELAGGVLGVGDAVGEGEQDVAGLHLGLAKAVVHVGQHAGSRPGGLETVFDAIRADDHRRIVAAVHVVELTGGRIQHGEEGRGEHVGVGMVAHDEIVGQVHRVLQRDGAGLWGETLARAAFAGGEALVHDGRPAHGVVLLGIGAVQAAEQRHEQGGADALVADVGNDQSNSAPLGELKAVVEIARNFTRRVKARSDLPARRLGQLTGQEAFLDLATDLHVALEFEQVFALRSP